MPRRRCCSAAILPGLLHRQQGAGRAGRAVGTVGQAARALGQLGANLLVVEMPGRTYFECRQMLRCVATRSRLSARCGLYLTGAGRPCASLK